MMKHTATTLLVFFTACTFEVVDETELSPDREEQPERPEVYDDKSLPPDNGCGYQEYGDNLVLPLECDQRPERARGTDPVENELVVDILEEVY